MATSRNDAVVYQAVSWKASERRRLWPPGKAGFLFWAFENITHASDGSQEFRRKRIVEFTAQAPHADIHYVRIALEIHVPHRFCDESSRQHLSGALHQKRKQH